MIATTSATVSSRPVATAGFVRLYDEATKPAVGDELVLDGAHGLPHDTRRGRVDRRPPQHDAGGHQTGDRGDQQKRKKDHGCPAQQTTGLPFGLPLRGAVRNARPSPQ